MPYVPSEKTDGKSQDRNLIDAKVELLASYIATHIQDNKDLLLWYKQTFVDIGQVLAALNSNMPTKCPVSLAFAQTVFLVGASYNYWGAFLGELNYGITRLIQRVPQIMVETKKWLPKDELRYWAYACAVQALTFAANSFANDNNGIGGVFEDIKDEYKVRVNQSYEIAQIEKSGDCYDTPYYSRAVRVMDKSGNLIGHVYVNVKRGEKTLHKDVLDQTFVLVEEDLCKKPY